MSCCNTDFVGSNCGRGWREDGLAEILLDEVARTWKNAGGGAIVEEATQPSLRKILDSLESRVSDGQLHLLPGKAHSNTSSKNDDLLVTDTSSALYDKMDDPNSRASTLASDNLLLSDPGKWFRVINAFEQPRVIYDSDRRHFVMSPFSSSLLPSSCDRIETFRDRYNRVYQRVLRNNAFRKPSNISPAFRPTQSSLSPDGVYNITFVSSLQGRNSTSHLLLGLIHLSPSGGLYLSDLTGTIALSIQHAKGVPAGETWFAPGMILLVDGIYEEQTNAGTQTSATCGYEGNVGGKFVVLSVAGPPCERREVSLGISTSGYASISHEGFGWMDFIGVGSERTEGNRLRRLKQKYSVTETRTKLVIMSEINLDSQRNLEGLRNVLKAYDALPLARIPLAFLLIGNFAQRPVMGGNEFADSIDYKEHFDQLALVLSDCMRLLQNSMFIFVPGDNDPWTSCFCVGAAPPIPRGPIPDLFTSRVRHAFNIANEEGQNFLSKKLKGSAIWTTNPARLSIFGPVEELVVFRDDISERLRRMSLDLEGETYEVPTTTTGINYLGDQDACSNTMDCTKISLTGSDQYPSTESDDIQGNAKINISVSHKLVKSLLDQGHLSPFPTTVRPVMWDYATALHLYPLPTTLILADPAVGPFTLTYEGCHVINPGRLVADASPNRASWVEYDFITHKSCIHESQF
ncbi:predicted protein [Uncinocarpus reesii 1704]|uniref:DNA polymerase epsilon subunit B n=1 Tax=Uncinocarpus reesii (strain UAMH 1704) TaxID=336963 RepID=C4JT86_UNCRE|nr:uncharacterized protein UREG_05675 [Uncinocarpus reesii 1704]EEP80833.1 predicted protein [Uncinocarpus reesii 1704]